MPGVDQGALLEQCFPVVCEASALQTSGARALVDWVRRGEACGARLLSCRRRERDGQELVVLEVEVPLGQRAVVNPIERFEPVAFQFADGLVPSAYPSRNGFPLDHSHINLAPEGCPKSLCLFDLEANDILRILSPHLLLERTKWWLVEAAYGRLHRAGQPLDPVFGGAAIPLIFLSDETKNDGASLVAFRRGDAADAPILVGTEAHLHPSLRSDGGFTALNLVTDPVKHGRIRTLPQSISQLIETYDELGVDLLGLLQRHFKQWCVAGNYSAKFGKIGILIVATPILRSDCEVGGVARKAFLLDRSMGELAVATGAVIREGEEIGPCLGAMVPSSDALENVSTLPATVYAPFDRSLAAQASGNVGSDKPIKILQAGCGALGSQIALAAARGGHGQWTLVDPDYLLPHNLARHGLSVQSLGLPKAEALADSICDLLGDGAAVGQVDVLQKYLEGRSSAPDFDLLIDASASVSVSRDLAIDKDLQMPIASAFLNPSGSDLVVAREASNRAVRLDHLEMDYYWELVTNGRLNNHLCVLGEFMPAGGCRHPSATIGQPEVMRAAGEAVRSIFDEKGTPPGTVEIHASDDDGRSVIRIPANRYFECDVAGWTIAISEQVLEKLNDARVAAAPNETGGIVVGTWDRRTRKGYLVALLDPPPDSIATPTGFVRGAIGVFHKLKAIGEATAQNLSYVGEWHTHPPRASSTPSDDDRLLMVWINDEVTKSDIPAIMMIGGDDGIRLCVGATTHNRLLSPTFSSE